MKLKKRHFFGLILFLASFRYVIIKLYRKYKNYPPGPIGYPFIGNLLNWFNSQKLMRNLGFKYNEIVFFTVGNENICIINSSKLWKKLLNKPELIHKSLMFNDTPAILFVQKILTYVFFFFFFLFS